MHKKSVKVFNRRHRMPAMFVDFFMHLCKEAGYRNVRTTPLFFPKKYSGLRFEERWYCEHDHLMKFTAYGSGIGQDYYVRVTPEYSEGLEHRINNHAD